MKEALINTTLDNGLRVAYMHSSTPVECMGAAIMAGSRDEDSSLPGLAHFVEHTIFKGTTHRRSHHVLNRMENIGGELNAYTTKEETFVYTLAPAHNTRRAIELIADLVANCTFPQNELDKEREVIVDEINSYLDTPDQAVFDDFEDLIYDGSQLGHNILGTKQSVRSINHKECRNWVQQHYHAGRMIYFYVGPASFNVVTTLASKYLSVIQPNGIPTNRIEPKAIAPFDITRNIKSHQSHTIEGCRLPRLNDREIDALMLFNNIVGGPGMNSRFNVALREKNGLVYTVESWITQYNDTTLWTAYYGCDHEHVDRCRQLVDGILTKAVTTPITPRALDLARRQFLGQAALSRSSVENTAQALGRCTLRGKTMRSLRQLSDDMQLITPTDITDAACRIIDSKLSILTLK